MTLDNSRPASAARRAGRQRARSLRKLQQQQAQTTSRAPRRGLAPDEIQDLCNALDLLCGTVHGDLADRLRRDYAPGTTRGNRARKLFAILPHLIEQPGLDQLIDANPDCPRWASQLVDILNADREFIAEQHRQLDDLEANF